MHKDDFMRSLAVGIIAAVVTVFVFGGGLVWSLRNEPETVRTLLSMLAPQFEVEPSTKQGSFNAESRVIEAVKKANPAVVAITVSKNVPVYERYYDSSSFGGMFPFFFSVPQVRQQGTELQEVGGGSGFLVSEDGYIVTNRHVVSDEDAQYTVFTNDGEKHDATIVARDSVLDIAIVKINGSGFNHLQFGDSSALEVGQSVIAIGNTLAEFRNTVSVGIVSGLSRSIVASDSWGRPESLDELVQTDAAINSGNSGGPLLNLNGEVIGVNVAIVSGAQNVGFALSGNSVKRVVDSVRETGSIVRPYLGVRYVPINKEIQKKNNLAVDYGVLVQRGATALDLAVVPGSPADKADIRENDIILEVDGQRINSDHSLASMIQTKNVGDVVRLKMLSRGEEKTISIMLEAMDM